jgi:putative colanic acid biosynthesis UDP-glucose lipid carrier transferase
MKRHLSAQVFMQIFLILIDFTSVYAAYICSFYVYRYLTGSTPQDFYEFLNIAVIPAGLCIVSFILSAVYRCQPGPMGLDQLKRLLSSYYWSGLMTWSLSFLTKSQGYSRLMGAFGFLLGILFLLIGRAIFVRIIAPLRSKHNLNRRILILGAGQVGKTLARNLMINSPSGYELAGFLDDQFPQILQVVVRAGDRDRALPILGKLSDLELECRKNQVNEVIVAMTRAGHALHQDLLDKVKDLNISFSIVPSALELMLTGAESYSIGRIPLFRIGEKRVFILSPILKRGFDVVGSLLIGILSAPIWIFTSILIKVDSKGPVLFVHERVGKDNKKFNLYKFRSMRIDSDPYAVTPQNQKDPRITKLGASIRRSSIDELPQLLNVLRGEMSLVGPRPEMPFIVDSYDELQKLRLSVKPGLTGVWQISADRANPIHENIDYDLYYLENQSFWLDLAILLKTFTSVLKGVGAY